MTSRCDCGCDDLYRVGMQYMLMNNPGQDIPSALTPEEKRMLLQEEPECRWCKQAAEGVEHNHFTNHVRGTACAEHNAWWRQLDAERYEGRTGPSSPPFYAALKLRIRFRKEVGSLIDELEFDRRERIKEIRAAAIEQLAHDGDESPGEAYGSGSGTKWVWRPGTLEETDGARTMYRPRTQRELEFGTRVSTLLIRSLTPDQRALVDLRYGARESMREIGNRYGTSKQAVEQRLKTVHKKLRSVLETELPGAH